MSTEETSKQAEEQGVLAGWRERLRELGKEAFQNEEMRRLGFWPPPLGTPEKVKQAEAELNRLDREMAPLRNELRRLEADIARAADVQSALAEIRQKRIERVRARRAQKKEQRAQQRAAKAVQDKARRTANPPFLGHGVSGGLNYEGSDPQRLAALGLPILHNASDIAAAMGIPPQQLSWLCYHRGAALIDHYHRFTIPKKNGGQRVISAPKTRLRRAQKWLLQNVLTPLPVHEAAMAFRPGVSILDNARQHGGKPLVMRVDLKDFFPSITFKRVKKMFLGVGYNEGVATLFALLATEAPRTVLTLDGQTRQVAVGERCLPQGACTSPAITNILCRRLDNRLTGAARHYGFTYTRYADDLVFSSSDVQAKAPAMLMLARRIIEDEGFRVNDEKTLVMRPQRRQTVTGIVVNAQGESPADGIGPRLSRHDIRRFRTFLHHYEHQGREAMTERLGQDALAYAGGYLSFIHMVNPQQAAKLQAAHPWLQRWQHPEA